MIFSKRSRAESSAFPRINTLMRPTSGTRSSISASQTLPRNPAAPVSNTCLPANASRTEMGVESGIVVDDRPVGLAGRAPQGEVRIDRAWDADGRHQQQIRSVRPIDLRARKV